MASARNRRSAALMLALAGALAACGTGTGTAAPAASAASTAPEPAQEPASEPASEPAVTISGAPDTTGDTRTPAPENTTSPEATMPSPTAPPEFSATVSKVSRDQVRYSWRPGCPVPLSGLRLITMTYWGFDDKAHTGELVVNAAVTDDIVSAFKKLYGYRFPIKGMEPVDEYRGSDFDSIEADNTSAFNCRNATGSSNWSQHAYGKAVDINPRENPYVNADGSNAHENANAFVERPLKKPGVINPGDRVVRAFEAVGWGWGGYWSGAKDYQHFSKSGG